MFLKNFTALSWATDCFPLTGAGSGGGGFSTVQNCHLSGLAVLAPEGYRS